jgi:hypothetical protein
MDSPLKREFEYYVAHQDELVKQFNGRVVVIKDQKVLGTYDNEMAAITETQKLHKLGTFLVQRVGPGTEAYTQSFHSRVA